MHLNNQKLCMLNKNNTKFWKKNYDLKKVINFLNNILWFFEKENFEFLKKKLRIFEKYMILWKNKIFWKNMSFKKLMEIKKKKWIFEQKLWFKQFFWKNLNEIFKMRDFIYFKN